MPRLIIPVLAMSALITLTDVLFSDTKVAPEIARVTVEHTVPSDTFAFDDGLGGPRRDT